MKGQLESLMLSLFDADGLRRYLELGPEGEVVGSELPTATTPAALAHAAAGVLLRRGLVDIAFFDRLQSHFPARSRDIRGVCAEWIAQRSTDTHKVTCPPIKVRDRAIARMAEQLEEAYQRREAQLLTGVETRDVDREILELRRAIRRGPQLQPGEILSTGRYRLVEVLGSGGFGTVWKAYDRELRSMVAIKVLHGQWSDDAGHRYRFVRGARMMMRLNHRGIVRVLREPCEEDGFHYFVMQYVPGTCLRRAVLAGGAGRETAIEAILLACDALRHLHEQGMIHRDIKPTNILIDDRDQVYLSDFDLSRSEDTTAGTITGAGLGTPLFAAPEALMDASEVDARADVYSMGMVLLFVALGRDLTLDDVHGRGGDSLRLPSPLTRVLRRATARRPEQRHASIAEFAEDLRCALPSFAFDVVARILSRFDERLEVYLGDSKVGVQDEYPVGESGTSVIVSALAWDELPIEAYVVMQDARAPAQDPTGPKEVPPGVSTGQILVDTRADGRRIVRFVVGPDFRKPTVVACQELVYRLVGGCLARCWALGLRSVLFSTRVGLLGGSLHEHEFLPVVFEAVTRELRDWPDASMRVYVACAGPTGARGERSAPHVTKAKSRVTHLAGRDCAFVDWTAATGGAQRKVPFACGVYEDALHLVFDVWAAFPPEHRPASRAYGVTWAMRNRATKELLEFARDRGDTLDDLGFVPGSEFEIVWLRSGA